MDAISYIKLFKNSPAWLAMSQTVEDSPYHREDNVAVHTEMVIEQYMTHFAPHRSDDQNKIALLALAFHDVGKPAAEETLEKKDGSGTYRRYAGHEQDSAIAFTECWLSDPVLRSFVSVAEARRIRWIIEHHLPYGYKDDKKRSDLRTAIEHTLREDAQTFYDCLRSDCWGRISDDHDTKKQNVEDWIQEFRTVPLTINRANVHRPVCYILVGPSGSGKTTWRSGQIGNTSLVLSLDDLRLKFYGDSDSVDLKAEYAAAWKYCNEHATKFYEYAQRETRFTFDLAVKNGLHVIIDNVNGSKKARAEYVREARNRQMKIVAVEFWNTFDTIKGRQKTRADKEVPEQALQQQYFAQTCAWLGSEVDEVIVVPGV